MQVFTVVSGESDLRVCWILNSILGINLALFEDIQIKSRTQTNNFRRYQFVSEDEFERYTLLVNRNNGNILIPELKKIDYIFIIQSQVSLNSLDTKIKQIKQHADIIAFISINYKTVKSFNKIHLS